jgi:tetratricopeptide (TPR) repeat protein
MAPVIEAPLLASLRDTLADRYGIERELGRGGMATVYLARDLKHGRLVALKLLQPELAAALGPERFLREIQVAARLQHPHILPLFDSGEAVLPKATTTHDSRPTTFLYYVMPYVAGTSLRQRLERERQLPLDEALRIARQVLAALGYAHSQGIVHRDIKPENILLQDDQAMVADFGIARAVSSAGGEELTATGLTLGTPTYMSPEQAAGEDRLDGRSDLYSVGCVVYEMLAGEPPFTGRTPQVILAKRLSEPVPHLSTIRDVPEWMERAIARALARSPADRFANAAQFAGALEARIGEEVPRVQPSGPSARRRSRNWIASGVLTLLAALGVGIWRWPRPLEPALDPNLVAVAPFDVLDPKLGLWREGLVDVLARTLDGLGPLRTVSPSTVLRRWAGRADPTSAQDLGRRTGARLAVFGQLVGVGADSVRLSATLLDVATGTRRTEFDRSDRADRLSSLADSLSLSFMRDLGVSARGPVRLSSVGTKSIVALKAFLQGEQHFRRGVLDSAIASFQRAAELDTTFALALRRLALAHGWKGDDLSGPFVLRACRFNHGLSPRDSLLLAADCVGVGSLVGVTDALRTAGRGTLPIKRGFEILETASRSYPDDPEVWYQLGEAREHNGFEIGATVAEELDAFDHSIALDSTFAEAYVHPIFRTLDHGDCRRAMGYLRPAASMHLALDNVPAAPAAALVLARLLDGTGGWRAEIQPTLDTLSGERLKDVTWMLRHCPDSAETDIWLARQLAQPRPGRAPMKYPQDANNILVLALMNRGHLRESYRVLREHPILVDEGSGFFFVTFALFGVVPKDTAAAVFRSWLEGPDVGPMSRPLPWWAGQGDTSSIHAFIERARAAVSARASDEGARRDAGEVARLGEVYLALARRDTAEAGRRLAGVSRRQDADFLRAGLFAAQRDDSAAAAVLDRETWEGPLNVLQRLLQAQVAERLGNRDEALRSYQFVVDMWRRPDPELSPYVVEAQAVLERLTREGAR